MISALFSWAAGYSSPVSGDIIESIKYLQFVPYMMAITFIGIASLSHLHKLLFWSAILVLLIGYIQVLNIPFLAEWLLKKYLGADSSHLASALAGYRITITGSDPNIGAVIASFFSIYFTTLFLKEKTYKYLIFALLFSFLILSTQSRTILGAFLSTFSFYFLFFYKLNFIIKIILLTLLITSIIFLVFSLELQYIYLGAQLTSEGENESLNIRLDNFSLAIERFYESPLFGMGPAKSEFSTVIDSEYALIIQRYGILGIFLFGFYIIYLLRLAMRNISSQWGITLFIFIIFSCVTMTTNNIFSGYQLMSIIVLLNITCVLHEKQNRNVLIKYTNLKKSTSHLHSFFR
ncbi:MAG: O-antigen ligase family protein [Thiofilum sp.]|uniref:O-antigen ligase family protein n=1 Tax=Thiofilum sp. TaxID=2212733 RepID=UPI0025E6C167|nr:O-antigen ligase family protein [Thiofilum sp.]MBK8453864.1 O-antigen ligase family protein [Thiofilum sp.]